MKTNCPECDNEAVVEEMDIFCDSCGKQVVYDNHTAANKVDLKMSIKCPKGCGGKAIIEELLLYCPSCD